MENQFTEFKQKFIEDAIVLIDELEQTVIKLEESPCDSELIESVFRNIHTLKGASSMYGFENIAKLSHDLESVFSLARDGKIIFEPQLIQITLNSADCFRALIQIDEEQAVNLNPILENISTDIYQYSSSLGLSISSPKQKKQTITNENQFATWQIVFAPEETIIRSNINLINTFQDVYALGNCKIIQNDGFAQKNKFNVFLFTNKTREDIEDALFFINDYCKIAKIADWDIFDEVALNQEIKYTSLKKDENIKIPNNLPKENKISNSGDFPEKDIIKPIELPIKTEEGIHEFVASDYKSIENLHTRINVEASKLDELMYLVTELITSNSQLVLASKDKIYNPIRPFLENIDKLSKLFRNNTLGLRLVPINEIIIRFQRLVRDLSRMLGKEVELITQGTETELDKSTIDAITDPLMHLIRNCIDHGIETPEMRLKRNKPVKGTIKITAFHSGSFVFIQISDDGGGIDIERIKKKAIEKQLIAANAELSTKEAFELIFLPGFSTAESLTQVSGRGVGMDVVKRKISEMRGQIEINSEEGLGTSFTIKLHQTIAILDTMLFQIDDMFFMVPLSDVVECRIIKYEDLEKRKYSSTVPYGENLLPYINLYQIFNLHNTEQKRMRLIILNRQEKLFAIAADCIIGEHQAVLKSVGEIAKKQEYIAVASILGNGNLAYLLDMNAIQKLITHIN